MGPDAMSARLIFRSPTRCRRGNQATIIGCDRRQRGGTDESQAAVRAPPLPPSASSPFLQAQSSISDPPDMLFSPPTVSVEGSMLCESARPGNMPRKNGSISRGIREPIPDQSEIPRLARPERRHRNTPRIVPASRPSPSQRVTRTAQSSSSLCPTSRPAANPVQLSKAPKRASGRVPNVRYGSIATPPWHETDARPQHAPPTALSIDISTGNDDGRVRCTHRYDAPEGWDAVE